ncbi:MAG: hypothetical protein ABIC91_07530 [Nanoarchaeota archaeon]|nr:hypothetical protein [Nanoarchaeota archaeon]MBU1029758.1 hypothetical protein [Nanoarchaeota archaeon]MBU1850765.1 hypothetical protein [Nanoarchaeota archaeon]
MTGVFGKSKMKKLLGKAEKKQQEIESKKLADEEKKINDYFKKFIVWPKDKSSLEEFLGCKLDYVDTGVNDKGVMYQVNWKQIDCMYRPKVMRHLYEQKAIGIIEVQVPVDYFRYGVPVKRAEEKVEEKK